MLIAVLLLSGCANTQGQIDLNRPNGIVDAIVYALSRMLVQLSDWIAGLGIHYSMGWAIVVFTIVIKIVTVPLSMKQLRSAKATQELQPRIQELQQKYGKDRMKLNEEMQKLYKEAGVNPMGGCLPLLIQMPILIFLYQALYALANPSVGKLMGQGFYWVPDLSVPSIQPPPEGVSTPGGLNFQGNNWLGAAFAAHQYGLLAAYLSLPVIMIISQLLLQKMASPRAADKKKGGAPDQTQMMGQMMMIMPLFFGYITLGLPAGLVLYWSISNILGVIQQYFVSGWGGLADWFRFLQPKPAPILVEEAAKPTAAAAVDSVAVKRKRRRK
jgi:YidC/Oxa1 family membrane protein insertase